MEFLAPGFLFLLPLAAAPWLWTKARQTPIHTALRTLCLALMILALARPAVIRSWDRQHVIVVQDASPSLSATEKARADANLSEWRKELPSDWILHESAPVQGNWTLADALHTASTKLPAHEPASIVLASDGHSRTDWTQAAAGTAELGMPMHALPLSVDAAELRVVGVATPDGLRVGHPGTVRVVVSGGPAKVRLQLSNATSAAPSTDPSAEVAPIDASSEAWVDGRSTVDINFEPTQAGFLNLQVDLQSLELNGGHDMRAEDNRWRTTVAVQPPLPVLYLGQRSVDGQTRLAQLLGPGFDLSNSDDLALVNLKEYAAVILDDRTAATVPDAFQQRLATAVTEHGLGLMMSGGAGSFGPGGWQDTVIADLLPIEFQQKEEKRDPSTTLVVIIDTSGSMGGNRVQLAKEVSRLAIRRLLPHDKVGIVEFYGAKRWAAPIQPASNSIELERALNRLDAGGGTVILPAVEEAFYGLQNVQTRYKHVLILTDGGVETGPFESMMRRMADKGMNVSTVLIGSQAHSEFLVNLANWGKGRFYHVPNRFNLPEIILKQPASAKLPAYRPGQFSLQTRGGSAWWGAADPKELPLLNGYVECRARPDSEVLIKTTDGNHPVLASWRFGAGRVTALTTEPAGPGTEEWSKWEGYGTFLAQVVQRTAADRMEPVAFEIERVGDLLTVIATSQNGHHSREPVTEPPLQWLASGPGQYRSSLTWPNEQEFRLQSGDAQFLVSPAASDAAPELQVDPIRVMPLAELAQLSGGGGLPEPGAPLVSSEGRSLRLQEYAPWLLIAALLMFLTDIFYRRRPSFGGVA